MDLGKLALESLAQGDQVQNRSPVQERTCLWQLPVPRTAQTEDISPRFVQLVVYIMIYLCIYSFICPCVCVLVVVNFVFVVDFVCFA